MFLSISYVIPGYNNNYLESFLQCSDWNTKYSPPLVWRLYPLKFRNYSRLNSQSTFIYYSTNSLQKSCHLSLYYKVMRENLQQWDDPQSNHITSLHNINPGWWKMMLAFPGDPQWRVESKMRLAFPINLILESKGYPVHAGDMTNLDRTLSAFDIQGVRPGWHKRRCHLLPWTV